MRMGRHSVNRFPHPRRVVSTTSRAFGRIGTWTRTVIASIAAIAMMAGMVLVGGTVATAADANDGIATTLTTTSGSFDGDPILKAGDKVTLKIQYDKTKVTPGSTVKIAMGPGLSIAASGGSIPVPDGNRNDITSVTVDPDGTVGITFADPLDTSASQQALLDLTYTVDSVNTSEKTDVTWTVGGTASSTAVVFVKDGDTPTDVTDGASKSLTSGVNPKVTVTDGAVAVTGQDGGSLVGKTLTYALTISTKDAVKGYTVTDTLPAGLSFGSVTGVTLSTWDSDGLNERTTTDASLFSASATDGGFTGTIDMPAHSKATVTYTATVAQAAVDALEKSLQSRYDAYVKSGSTDGTWISANLGDNKADFNGSTSSTAGSVSAGYSIPGVSKPNAGSAFSKSEDWSSRTVTTKDDGTLDPAQSIAYTLKADLSQWDGTDSYHTLTRNVVIDDPLPSQASWDATAGDFITASGIALTKVSCSDGENASDFASTDPGSWCVVGQHLLVNVGEDSATKATITAKATITTVKGLPTGWTNVQGATAYTLTNTAKYYYGVDHPYAVAATSTLTDLGDTSGGVVDTTVFSKVAAAVDSNGGCQQASNEIHADDTTHVTKVCYIFTVNGVDVTKSAIVDTLDLNIFDAGTATVTGQYAYWKSLTSDDFTTSLNRTTGELSIALSDTGKTLVTGTDGGKGHLNVYLVLDTKPIVGTQTVDITNHAKLTGANTSYDYAASASSSFTTYGASAEVKKYLWDEGGHDWTQNLRVTTDDGTMTTNEFVYQLKFTPHCSADGTCYTGVAAITESDTLPAGVTFEGFVTNASTTSVPMGSLRTTTGTVDLGNNGLQASYADGVVSISQKSGTKLQNMTPSYAYVLVKVNDPISTEPIVNTIGGNSATIVPGNDYTLNIAKKDSSDLTKQITDRNARFQILESDKSTVAVDDVAVVDGFLRVKNKDGDWVAPTLGKAGTYWVKEVAAPSGYETSSDLLQVTVGDDQSIGSATVYDTPESSTPTTPATKSYALGDLVWVDASGNGVQDEGEEPLSGVSVSLTDVAGDPVRDVAGRTVAPVTTDSKGRYLFDGLPAGDYVVHFALTSDQAARYAFTSTDAGSDDAADSDATPDPSDAAKAATGTVALGDSDAALTTEYKDQTVTATQGMDPTWDAGVVVRKAPSVSVGDYVWLDADGDGLQDSTDEPLSGVMLTLTGPDGKPVTDVDGNPVGPATTDSKGHYEFTDLPTLTSGEHYTVTVTPPDGYEATKAGADNGAGSLDSSTGSAVSRADLSADGDSDMTLDFGFVRKTGASVTTPDPENPTPSPTPTTTGGTPTVAPDKSMTHETPAGGDRPSGRSGSSSSALARTGSAVAAFLLIAALALCGGLLAWEASRRGSRRDR